MPFVPLEGVMTVSVFPWIHTDDQWGVGDASKLTRQCMNWETHSSQRSSVFLPADNILHSLCAQAFTQHRIIPVCKWCSKQYILEYCRTTHCWLRMQLRNMSALYAKDCCFWLQAVLCAWYTSTENVWKAATLTNEATTARWFSKMTATGWIKASVSA